MVVGQHHHGAASLNAAQNQTVAADRPRLDSDGSLCRALSQPTTCCRPSATWSTHAVQCKVSDRSLTHLQYHTSLICLIFGQQRQQQPLLMGRHLQAHRLLSF